MTFANELHAGAGKNGDKPYEYMSEINHLLAGLGSRSFKMSW